MIRKNHFIRALVLIFAVLTVTGHAQETKRDTLTLSGPRAVVSYPFLYMIEQNRLADIADQVEFKLWNNPDQLRAIVVGEQADFVAIPTNVAAIFFNKGVDLKLLNVSVWGILWMVSRDPELKTLADFKGKEIAMPFKGDMPEILFSELALKQGLDPKKDFELRYVNNPMDALQLLMLRRVDHALLAEPAISMLLHKSQTLPMKLIAPDLYRSVDLQAEWGRLYQTDPKIPQAGIAVTSRASANSELVKRVQQEYAAATLWCSQHPDQAAELVAKHIPPLESEPVAQAIRITRFENVPAEQARQDLEAFYTVLFDRNPAKIGGKLPADGFYAPTP